MRMGKNNALQSLLTGADLTSEEAEAETFLEAVLGAIRNLALRDIMMSKEIVAVSVRDEAAGAELELRHFLERAREDKTQAIIAAFLTHGRQIECEATDFEGVFADTAAELSGY